MSACWIGKYLDVDKNIKAYKEEIMRFKNFILFIFILCTNLFGESLFNTAFKEKLTFEKFNLAPKELFDILSKKSEIKFIYEGENNFYLIVKDFQNQPLSRILGLLGETFDFYLKFDDDLIPYFYVKLKDNFIGKTKEEGKVRVSFEGATLKDVFSTLEEITGKRFKVERQEILNKKTYIKYKDIDWQELLKKLAEENGFNYKIENEEIKVW